MTHHHCIVVVVVDFELALDALQALVFKVNSSHEHALDVAHILHLQNSGEFNVASE